MTVKDRVVGVVTGAALVAVLVSCAGDDRGGGPTASPREPRPTPPTPPTTRPEGVTFSASMIEGRTEDTMIIRYRVVNDGPEPVVVFNRVPARDSPNVQPAEPDNVYVTPSGDTSVRLSKQVFGTPEGVAVNARMVIGGTTVEPGDRLTERIETNGSFTVRRPHQDVLGVGPTPVRDPTRITLCVGVAPADEVTRIPTRGAAYPVYAHDTPTASQQSLYCQPL